MHAPGLVDLKLGGRGIVRLLSFFLFPPHHLNLAIPDAVGIFCLYMLEIHVHRFGFFPIFIFFRVDQSGLYNILVLHHHPSSPGILVVETRSLHSPLRIASGTEFP